ncbi:ABC transporter ATP-binding protein [Dactylosporangium sp. NPDC049140]|uniref:ABC transporter ATP-binding protein n=1 Tax=Dactylosporangium sp. NPDC049140 TaxID=3155647 RepID=UPI00340A035C
MTAEAVVRITGLDIGYTRHRKITPAVAGLDLTVNAAEVVAVVGESGSGKTTIANAVIGLLPPNGRITAGSALVDGVQIAGAKERVLRRLRGSVVGLIPQDPMVGLNPTMRIGAQLTEVVRLRGITGAAAQAEAVRHLDQAGVPDPETRIRQYPHELSGGLRQRVLIAIALAGKPKLIIADEPTSALDVTVQRRILDHLGGLVREQGISLLIITHDLAVAADRADRVVVMHDGRKVEEGGPGTILTAPREEYTRRLIAAAPRLAHGGRVVPRFDVREQPQPEPILTLTEVSKTFASNDLRRGARGFNAVDRVSLTVRRGQTHAIVGESGCGKTTTLRVALGLEPATSGSILLDGTEVAGRSWSQLRPLRRKAQLVHQDPFAALDPKFTVRQSITEPLVSFKVGDRRTRESRAQELLDQVALPMAYLDRLPSELSGGQRQRVAIARALALSPQLLMLDEPVSALDVLVQDQILRLLVDLQERLGLSYLFVSHDLGVVAEISHTVSVMSGGKVVEEGPVAEVFTNPQSPHTRELIDAVPGRAGADRPAPQRPAAQDRPVADRPAAPDRATADVHG